MKKVSQGCISSTYSNPKIIFQTGLLCHATQIIIVHNHPSGNKFPSTSDKQMAHKLKQGGELLEIPVLDHVILTNDEFYSFADEGEM